MGTQLLQWEGADIFWLIIFFYLLVYLIWITTSIQSLRFTSYPFILYYVMRAYTAKHHLIVIIQICTILLYLLQNTCLFTASNAKCLLSFFLLNSVNNWFCNRDNSIVLFVALPHLLYMYIYIFSVITMSFIYIYSNQTRW